jgi:pyruvate formate lyase activating enzyme
MTTEHSSKIGYIHSFESLGTLDGPGIRLVIFLAGCPLRCAYCHNIDVVYCQNSQAQKFTTDEIIHKLKNNQPYFEATGGGVTVSGGDPVLQSAFVIELFQKCQEQGIHTAFDTSLYTSKSSLDQLLPVTDLFLISLKHFDDQIHQQLTQVSNQKILENITYLSKKKARIWFRYLVLPGFTDTESNLKALINFCHQTNFELIELLAYHEHGKEKWLKLGLDYELESIKPPTEKSLKAIKSRLEAEGFEVKLN